jgi:hypothetical protein
LDVPESPGAVVTVAPGVALGAPDPDPEAEPEPDPALAVVVAFCTFDGTSTDMAIMTTTNAASGP